MSKHNWENFGDANPLEHGGLWLLQDEGNQTEFNIVQLQIDEDLDGRETYYITDGHINVTDEWIDWKSVIDTTGLDADDSREWQAVSAIHTYGMTEFGGWPKEYLTREGAKAVVEAYGITLED
jgi:hypothetical protein